MAFYFNDLVIRAVGGFFSSKLIGDECCHNIPLEWHQSGACCVINWTN